METFGSMTRLELNHVQIIVRGMWAVAKSDGVHEKERTMLRDFYNGCIEDVNALAEFDDLISQEFDADEAREILDTPELQAAFLQSCMFLAYADGGYSDQERDLIQQMAKDIGIDQALVDEVRDRVGDHLIGKVARTSNIDALKEVADEVFR